MAKEKKCCAQKVPERLGKVGGQAVIEGVMMKAGPRTVTTCRKEDKSLVVYDGEFTSVRKKHKILNIPILRGVINFIEMMILSVKTLSNSADALGIEEEEGKFEKWMKKHLGIGITTVIMAISVVLGVALAIVLFMLLPNLISDLIDSYIIELGLWSAIVEGVLKIAIFLVYLWLVSLIPDIKRTFMYHGAEHKSIACFEAGGDLTPEKAKEYTRFHPRCGTSFMFFMILLGVFAGLFVKMIPGIKDNVWAYTGIRLLILPLVMGLGYEFIMFAGKHDNFFTRAMSAPGLWVQRLTTKEPTEDMLEVAIISIKCALRDDFPEFKEFYYSRAWEPKAPEADDESAEATAQTDAPAEESAEAEVAETEISEAEVAEAAAESEKSTENEAI
jgi:uncharacterized protein YqhQ